MASLHYLVLIVDGCFVCDVHIQSEDKEVEASKDNFVELVQTLLEDSMKREHFFQVRWLTSLCHKSLFQIKLKFICHVRRIQRV